MKERFAMSEMKEAAASWVKKKKVGERKKKGGGRSEQGWIDPLLRKRRKGLKRPDRIMAGQNRGGRGNL